MKTYSTNLFYKYEKNTKKNLSRKWWLYLLLLFMIASILYIYFDSLLQTQFSIVKVNGVKDVINYSKTYYLTEAHQPEKYSHNQVASVVAEDGDIIAAENYYFTYHKGDDSINISVSSDKSKIYKDGKLSGLHFYNQVNLIPWLSQVPTDSLRNLELLSFDTSFLNGYLPFIEMIASFNKEIAIELDNVMDTVNYQKEITVISHLFKPRLLLVSLLPENLYKLEDFKTVQTLILGFDEGKYPALPALPHLKECIIIPQADISLGPNFFSKAPSVEKFSFIQALDAKLTGDHSFLDRLPNLRVLVLDVKGTDLEQLFARHPKLRVLNFYDAHLNPDSLTGFANLKWLGLPFELSQPSFDKMIVAAPNLEVLELCGNDSLANLSMLTSLKDLRALIVQDTLSDRNSIARLTQLHYLSLPKKTYKDSNYVRSLEKAMPGTLIVPNSGVCLGSGWLLLLIPLIMIFGFVQFYYKKRNVVS